MLQNGRLASNFFVLTLNQDMLIDCLKTFILSILGFFVITLIVIAALVMMLKIFMAINRSNQNQNIGVLVISNVKQQQMTIASLQRAKKKLYKLNKTFSILYSLYKQLLYVSTGMYQGTNLTSIFATLKIKQSSKTEHSNQTNPIQFQELCLKNIKKFINSQIEQLIHNVILIMDVIAKGPILLKSSRIQQSKTFQFSGRKVQAKLSDLLQSNIFLRKRLKQIQQKFFEFSQSFQSLIQSNDDRFFVSVIRDAAFFIAQIQQFLLFLQKYYIEKIQIQFSIQSQSQKKELEKQLINQIIKEILNQKTPCEIIENQNYSCQINYAFKYIKEQIQVFINERTFQQISYEYDIFLEQQIKVLQSFKQRIKQFKSEIQINQNDKKGFETKIQQKIRVFSTNMSDEYNQQSQMIQKSQQYNQYVLKSHSKEIQESHTAFSAEKKLSFIKQLDRLMVRNRIRRELEQMERKIKEQEQIQYLQNKVQQPQNPNIVLQKIEQMNAIQSTLSK